MDFDEIIQQPGQKEMSFRDEIFRSLHVALPGEVVSYNNVNHTVVVQPTIRELHSTANPPLLIDVPVFMWGNYECTPVAGDRCLVVFADSCIDAWFQNGGVSNPIVDRKHDMSDGFAFVGFNRAGLNPLPSGGGGSSGALVRTYTVTNASGQYENVFQDNAIVSTMKPVLIEAGTPTVFGSDIGIETGDGTLTITCDNVSGTSTVTVTMIGGPSELSPTQYEIIMDKIGCFSVANGKLCITYET